MLATINNQIFSFSTTHEKLLQKNWKEECEEKKKRIEREADSQYVEGVIDVE